MPRLQEGRNRFPRLGGTYESVWSPEMYRALIDVVDESKPTKLGDLPKLAVKIEEALTQLPEERTNAIALTKIKEKVRRFPLTDTHSCATFLRRGREVVNYSKLPANVLPEDQHAEWVKERQRSKKVKKKGVEPAEAESNAAETPMNQMSQEAEEVQSVLDDYAHTLAHSDGPRLQAMKAKVAQIEASVSQAVKDRLWAAKRHASEIVVDFHAPRSSVVTDLVEILMGSPLEPGLANLQAFQQTVPLTLEVFVKAIIGAAITKWALQAPALPEPDEDSGAVLEALVRLHRRLDPIVAASMIDDAHRVALKQSVTPRIGGKASGLAADLNRLLLPFIMPRPSNETVPHLRSSSRPALDNGTGGLKQAQTPPWVLSWKSELQRIFLTALTLRVDFEDARGECSFDYPKPGESRVTRGQGNLPDQSQGTVLIGTFPRISARFPDGPGGPLGAEISVAEAQFYCFQETVHESGNASDSVVGDDASSPFLGPPEPEWNDAED